MKRSASGARDLTQGGVSRTLIAFALPTLAVNVLQTLNGTISAIFVGKMLGEASLAAAANANQLMFAVFSLVFGFAMAATILIGQAVGRNDMAEVKRTSGASFAVLGLAGIGLAVAGYLATPAILDAMAVPDDVYPLAVGFVQLVFVGLPVSLINMLLPALLRGVGDSTSPLWNTALNVLLCLLLNPLLIKLYGLNGAAIAGILANLICVVVFIFRIYRMNSPIALKGADLALLKPDKAHATPLIMLGFPLGLSMVIMGVSQLIVIGLVNREGMATVAGFGAVNQLWSFLQMPAFAVSTAVSAMAAQNIGAARWDRVGQITRSGIWINMAMTGLVLLAMTLFITPLLTLFLPAGSPAIAIGAHINLLVGWTYILNAVSSVATSVIRANGKMLAPLIILIISGVFIRFAVAFPFYPTWGADAIWASFAATAISGTAMGLAWYRWGPWRESSVRGGAPAIVAQPVPVVPEPGLIDR
jgi:putative MATE family efflux protein